MKFAGLISEEREIELIQRVRVYMQPTRYEGFGGGSRGSAIEDLLPMHQTAVESKV